MPGIAAERDRHGIGLATAFCVIWNAWNNKKRHSFHGQAHSGKESTLRKTLPTPEAAGVNKKTYSNSLLN